VAHGFGEVRLRTELAGGVSLGLDPHHAAVGMDVDDGAQPLDHVVSFVENKEYWILPLRDIKA
jgi:hypothetical protein